MKDLLLIGEAAQLLGLTPAGLRYHADRNRVKAAARTSRGLRLYTLAEILRFQKERIAALGDQDRGDGLERRPSNGVASSRTPT